MYGVWKTPDDRFSSSVEMGIRRIIHVSLILASLRIEGKTKDKTGIPQQTFSGTCKNSGWVEVFCRIREDISTIRKNGTSVYKALEWFAKGIHSLFRTSSLK